MNNWLVRTGFSLPLIALSGCLFHTRHLPVPQAPQVVQSATADQLVDRLNQSWAAIQTLDDKVEIAASKLNTAEGAEKDFTAIPAIILVRKPAFLRVYGQVPVVGTRMFDMVSNGDTFLLWIPSENKAIRGPAALHKRSANMLENIRPDVILNAMAVRGLDSDDFYTMASESETIEDPARKHLYSVPEYVLTVTRSSPNSHHMTLVRVVTFHREDLLPYQQDLYDPAGNLETQISYKSYRSFNGSQYPSQIVIKLPIDGGQEWQFVLDVESVTKNLKLNDQQFQIELPKGTQVQDRQ